MTKYDGVVLEQSVLPIVLPVSKYYVSILIIGFPVSLDKYFISSISLI